MKKLLSFTLLLFSTVVLYAQIDVTRFLGIPVDGIKSGNDSQTQSNVSNYLKFK